MKKIVKVTLAASIILSAPSFAAHAETVAKKTQTIATDVTLSMPGTLGAVWTAQPNVSTELTSDQALGQLNISFTNGNMIGIKEVTYSNNGSAFMWKNSTGSDAFLGYAEYNGKTINFASGGTEALIENLDGQNNISVKFKALTGKKLTPGKYTENMVVSLYSA